MIKKLSALILSLCLVSGAIIAKADDEVPVSEPMNNVSIGAVNVCELTAPEGTEAPTRIFSLTVADVGTKKMMYFISNTYTTTTKKIFAYELADDGTATYVNSITDANTCAHEAGIYVKDGYLIYGSYKNNASYINFVAIDPTTGEIGSTVHHTVTAVNNTNYVHKIKLIDNMLFVNANSNIFVYELENIADKVIYKTTVVSSVSSGCGGMEAEKISNIRYRVYTFSRTSPMTMNISDVLYETGEVSVSNQNANLTVVEGVEFTGNTKGVLNKVAVDRLNLAWGTTKEYIVDVANPEAPKITGMKTVSNNTQTPIKMQIDINKAVEISKNSTYDSGVVDYTVDDAVGNKTTISGIAGEGAWIDENVIYTAKGAKLYSLEFFDAYTISTPVVEPSETALTATINIDNYLSKEFKCVLFAAVYKDGKMITYAIEKNETNGLEKNDVVTAELDVENLVDYTVKAWVFDNFGNMKLLTDVTTEITE